METDEWTKHPSAAATATAYLGVARRGDVVGWGVVQELWTPGNSETQTRRFSGIQRNATANRGWLIAAAESLERSEGLAEHILIAPSRYLTDNLGLTLRAWEVNGWVRQDGNPVANKDDWGRILIPFKSIFVRAYEPSSEAEETLCEEAKRLAIDAITSHAKRGDRSEGL